jgi:ribosome assembly protein 1
VLDEEELRGETTTHDGEPTEFQPMREHSRIRVPEHWRRNVEVEDPAIVTFNNIVHRFDSALLTGFQLATAAGPAMEEPMYGVCFVLQQLDIVRGLVADLLEDSSGAGAASAAGLTGQLISETKVSCTVQPSNLWSTIRNICLLSFGVFAVRLPTCVPVEPCETG